ncbi:MAG: alginate lyase family protein [Myxococcaceae bacterium]
MASLERYAHLTRQLSAAQLAKFAGRRAYRMARRALFRRQSTVLDETVFAAFSARSLPDLMSRLQCRAGLSTCELAQRDSVVAAVKSLPGAAERALDRAERALRREFQVFGETVRFEGEIAWSRDPRSGHVYPSKPSDQIALLAGGADPKDVWELGRLESLIALGQGGWLSPERRDLFAKEAAAQLTSFLSENPCGLGIHWTCAMEVALRGANLARAILMFADVFDGELMLKALRSLIEHSAFVEANLEDSSAVPNNHLVADHAGLLVMALLFPELPSSDRQVVMALRGLEEQLATQVHPDGMSFEGSVPYHRLSLELFTLALVHARDYGVSLSSAYTERLSDMYFVAARYCSSKGLAPQWGDNDSGRALALTDRGPLEHGYLAGLGAALFGWGELKSEGATAPDEVAWLLGQRGVFRFERTRALFNGESFSTDGGLHVLRGHDVLVAISAGPNGQNGVGGHSHNDKLSFELHLRGEPVIVDPGTGTYSREPALRNRLRSTEAHSTVQLERQEQAPIDPARLFALREHANARVVSTLFGEDVDRLVAEHTGFSGVTVQRTFLLNKGERSLTVTDLLNGEGVHSVVSRLALPDVQARLRPLTNEERARAGGFEAVGPVAVELGLEESPHAVVLTSLGVELSLDEAVYSPGYGQWRRSLCVAARMERTALPARLGFLILWWDR